MKTLTTVKTAALFIVTALTISAPAVMAADFDDSIIQHNFASFSDSLDRTSKDMVLAHESEEKGVAERYALQAKANQDTELAGQREFQRGQQQMLDSGGAYNSQGFIWGSPWGMNAGAATAATVSTW